MSGYAFTVGGVRYAVAGTLTRVLSTAQDLADEIGTAVKVSSAQDHLATLTPRASS
jgi:hypothetical protein